MLYHLYQVRLFSQLLVFKDQCVVLVDPVSIKWHLLHEVYHLE